MLLGPVYYDIVYLLAHKRLLLMGWVPSELVAKSTVMRACLGGRCHGHAFALCRVPSLQCLYAFHNLVACSLLSASALACTRLALHCAYMHLLVRIVIALLAYARLNVLSWCSALSPCCAAAVFVSKGFPCPWMHCSACVSFSLRILPKGGSAVMLDLGLLGSRVECTH